VVVPVLSPEQCRQFVEDGFVVVREVVDRDLAAAASELVWDAIGRHARGWSSLENPAAWYAVEGEPFTSIADLLGPLQIEGPANGRSLVEEAVIRALARHDGV
jgi:hypothetical protein